ncbi:hypothetical protein DFH07DRAFT_966756 [Mycena maculata]|uniref:Uncharacterized protein n=1 Tax=Mycena maculata TaxID=230809 RepID=A0AAD7MX39_9AGAR|nr:hypothetical protein DFH07DRAFT_966756 [Mycena maculata]
MSTSHAPSNVPNAPPAPPTPPAKRKYRELTQALAAAQPVKKKLKSKRSPPASKTAIEQLISAGKYFPRAISPFMDISLVFHDGAETHWKPPPSSDAPAANEDTADKSELEQQAIHTAAFDLMMSSSPGLLEVVQQFYLSGDLDEWHRLVKAARDAATDARTADTNSLKHRTEYVVPDSSIHSLYPTIDRDISKSDRGTTHPMLRHYIVGWKYQLKLGPFPAFPTPPSPDGVSPLPDAAPVEASAAEKKMLKAILDGKKPLLAKQYPSCFWAEGSYDASDPKRGFLRSPFLLRVTRHIWTAPGSVRNGIKKGKLPPHCNARILGVRRIVPEMIGYSCAQGRTMLSTSEWSPTDGSYEYGEMFDAVVRLFKKDPTNPWAVDTLEWYQRHVFSGDQDATEGPSDPADSDEDADDDMEMSIFSTSATSSSPASAMASSPNGATSTSTTSSSPDNASATASSPA